MTPRARDNRDTGWRINRARVTAEAVGSARNASKDSWRGADATTRQVALDADDYASARVKVADLTLTHHCEDDAVVAICLTGALLAAPAAAGRLWRVWRHCHERAVCNKQLLALRLREPKVRVVRCHPTGTRIKTGECRVVSDGQP